MSDFLRLHSPRFDFREFVRQAVREDIGDGDHTSQATISTGSESTMHLLVKESGVIAGIEAAQKILKEFDKSITLKKKIRDGSRVSPGDIAFILEGKTRSLLGAERLLLNVMQRMSGIATKTHNLQMLCKGTVAKVTDTRKTTPGFRFFEKWAVKIGGGINHRYGLYDMILIKDNHVDAAGGIGKALDACSKFLRKTGKKIKVELEARNLDDVKCALDHGGLNRIMLDNFSIANTRAAVRLIGNRLEIESSGGITEKNLSQYARCGVDYISIGALTHHVKSLDLSLKIRNTPGSRKRRA
jgi:nicotinate-nucleotide pyrophosphorylase (carboxylating)